MKIDVENPQAVLEDILTRMNKGEIVERKKGKWKEYPIADECLQCSCCGVLRMGEPSNFCPWCGADMRESEQGFWWARNMFAQTEEKKDG